jgi:hypothetical protein
MNTAVQLLVVLVLLAACSSPAASPSPMSAVTPTPTFAAATSSPLASATAPRDLADALAKAFASKDADAVGRLLSRQDAIGVSAVVEPVQQSEARTGNCCVLILSVVSFVNELRGKFADGSLTVAVDPQLQPTAANAPGPFLVTSDWRESDRTVRIDLYLRDLGGGWQWTSALHHYPLSAAKGVCIVDYRPPWVPTGTKTYGC